MYKWAGEVTQLIRALTAMPDDLSLTPRIQMESPDPANCRPTPTHMCYNMRVYLCLCA